MINRDNVSEKFGGFRLRPGDSMTSILERMPESSRSLLMEQADEHVRQARDRLGRSPTTRAVAIEAYLTGYFNASMQKRSPSLVLPEDDR